MRPFLIALLGIGLIAATPVTKAYAQSRQDEDDQKRQQQDEADKKKKQKEKEWALGQAPLPKYNAAGPCPFVRVLYDAGRYMELKADKEAVEAVGFTGEIEGVRSSCSYKGDEPIDVDVAIGFGLGRGPQAAGPRNTYRYWVAVTLRNQVVITKQYFDLPVEFASGEDRTFKVEHLKGIRIPRANAKVNGSNFEVLVGFDVTPAMADFNRQGKRFRMNAFQALQGSAKSDPAGPPAAK